MNWYRLTLNTSSHGEEIQYMQAHSAKDAQTCIETSSYVQQQILTIACVDEKEVPDHARVMDSLARDYAKQKTISPA